MHISYRYTQPGTEEFKKLQLFAKSFHHEINPSPSVNVYAHFKDDVCFGYSDHVFCPVVYPAFHPSLTTPRDVVRVMSDWKAHMQLSGKLGHIGVPLEGDRMFFPEDTMQKLGLVKTNREIYIPT
jgi:hypothetical protein